MVTRIGTSKAVRVFLREWREYRDLTQEQLAARLETTKTTISRKENDHRRVDVDYMAAVAEALQCEPADLFRDPRQPSPQELLNSLSEDARKALYVIHNERRTGTNG